MKTTDRIITWVAASFCAAATAASASTITQWTFEGDVITPDTGSGVASLLGGTTESFAAGSGGGRGWNTTTYAAQGAESGQRGVQFLVDTTGFESITLSFDHRASGTASRWAQIDYTLDGGDNWTVDFWNNAGGLTQDTFVSFNVDFSAVTGANNNADFGFRIVSILSPLAFDQNATLPDFDANTAYMRANPQASYTPGGGTGTGDYGTGGTWRFDNVTFAGTVVPEPTVLSLVALGVLGLMFRQRLAVRR